MAIPSLRAFTNRLLDFIQFHQKSGWDSKEEIPISLREQVRELQGVLMNWPGRPFFQDPTRVLHSDASNIGWGGIDVNTGDIVHEFWRKEKNLHINVKELWAAISTVKSLAKQNDIVHLHVDNQVTFWYLTKQGGRKSEFNALLRPFLQWCVQHAVTLQVSWIQSDDDKADYLSHLPYDRGDYTLQMDLFQTILSKFQGWVCPTVDCFASPGNAKFPLFISRTPHWGAVTTDALHCPLHTFSEVYANPPWTLIGQWLERLRQNSNILCLTVTPFWVGAPWWPHFLRLHC